jgi:hypothetical protein
MTASPCQCLNFLALCFFFFFAASQTACTGLVQKSGETLEGSAFIEKTTAVYRSGGKKGESIELKKTIAKDGAESVDISSGAWPGLILRSVMDSGGNLELSEARFLSSHVQGWNEFTMNLLGSAAFEKRGNDEWLLYFKGEPERIQIASGKIRLKSSYLTGTAALSSLRNRRERILAITGWMKQSLQEQISFENQKEFEAYWRPLLFPELVSAKKRPPEYPVENSQWRRADSVRWNQSYTEKFFPEQLWELRNSGALLRDWEEAHGWIFMEYSWSAIIGSFNDTTLLKAK